MKKKRSKTRKPPLSKVDKFLYALFALVVLLLTTGLLCLYIFLLDRIAFSDKSVIAVDNGSSTLFILPFLLLFGMLGIILSDLGYSRRVQLFGYSKKEQQKIKIQSKAVPLLKKGGIKQYLTRKSKRQYAKTLTCFIAALLGITILFSGFGLFKRTVLYTNDQIISYNSLNQRTDSVHLQDADNITVSIQKTRLGLRRRRSPRRFYYVQLQIQYGDEKFTINPGDFDNMSTAQVLEYMLHIKGFFTADQCTIRNIEYLDNLQEHKDYDESEVELLLTLFEQ
ncbi:MAG: hypothetical protein E7523_01790 [Ruminococcaceae bacterium]|nr:hypothetical protein [Oscillospiraceae bacterium]